MRGLAFASRWLAPGTVICLPLISLLSLGLATCAVQNLDHAGIWWDESASIWHALGLSRYAEPFAEPSGLRDVVRLNRDEALDPGGFAVLSHG